MSSTNSLILLGAASRIKIMNGEGALHVFSVVIETAATMISSMAQMIKMLIITLAMMQMLTMQKTKKMRLLLS